MNQNGTYYVVNGILDFKFNGTVKDDSNEYTIVNSKVVYAEPIK